MAVWRIIIIYSSAVWSFVLQKNQVTRLPINWEDEITLFIDYAKGSSFRRSALKLSLPAVVYSICCERNTRIFQHKFLDPDSLCAKIFNSIRDAMVSWRDVKTKQMYIKSNKLAKAETVQRKVLHIMELSKIGAGFLLLLCYVLCPGLHLLTGKIVLKEQEIAYKGFSSVDAALKSYSFLVMMLLLLLLLVSKESFKNILTYKNSREREHSDDATLVQELWNAGPAGAYSFTWV
ncbi:uncharacterized protein LOC131334891 [Rhododendron vialii]|uniref:uncharacterized protein LOC131334891 n=1 Tax=Rhododendron vialii TaxID=182163 RepID=UPI00265F5BF8|nr:uncharacterized protein LOC131334891 [Rhododendron vialii]